jgi:aminoglycoside phosphotransferase
VTVPGLSSLAGYSVEHEWRNDYEGSAVMRMTRFGGPTLYVKTAPCLRREHDRLKWCQARLPVPAIIEFAEGPSDTLVTAALAGIAASERTLLPDTAAVVDAVAQGLRLLHGLPAQDCPFDTSTDALLSAAEASLKTHYEVWDESEQRMRAAGDVFDELVATRPTATPAVVLHGDASLPNFLITEGEITGLVDLGFLGVGDPWWDLATCLKSIQRPGNAIAHQRDRFLKAYGATDDPSRERWFRLLYGMDTRLP